MDAKSYITGFVVGFVVARAPKYLYKVDVQLQSRMLDFLYANKEFTVSQFTKAHDPGLGFFAKYKVRRAAMSLVEAGKANYEIPKSSSFFNRDETVKFIYK